MNKTFIKKYGFTSLAFLLACTGVVAFAPLGITSAQEQPTTTTGLGLDPKNDPVIYTTEKGLEIKYGGFNIEASLASGALKGYPYFTMGSYSGNPVNWVIIGRNPNVNIFDSLQTCLFEAWKTKTNGKYQKYFFGQIFEKKSPAGTLIDTISSSKTYVKDYLEISLSSITSNTEIDSNCVLVVSEKLFNFTRVVNAVNSSNYEGSSLQSYHEDLYTSALGLTNIQKEIIVPQTLTNIYYPSNTSTSTNQHIFAFADRGENFDVDTYLTSSLAIVTSAIDNNNQPSAGWHWYLRSGRSTLHNSSYHVFHCIDSRNGSKNSGSINNTDCPIRPIMVIKVQ